MTTTTTVIEGEPFIAIGSLLLALRDMAEDILDAPIPQEQAAIAATVYISVAKALIEVGDMAIADTAQTVLRSVPTGEGFYL